MAAADLPLHGPHHGPDGPDPIPAAAAEIYIDDRRLSVDATEVLFESFPDSLVVLELTWETTLTGDDGGDATVNVAFNDDYPSTEHDYFWKLAGSIGLRNGDGSDNWGSLGFASTGTTSWGRVRFPNYNIASPPRFSSDSREFLGEGGWANTGGGADPDVWSVSGYGQNGDEPLTKIHVFAALLSGLPDVMKFAAGSRFTLVGY